MLRSRSAAAATDARGRRRRDDQQERASAENQTEKLPEKRHQMPPDISSARRRLASGFGCLAVGCLPTPGSRAVAALGHPLLVDLGNDLAIAGKQRFGRAHFGAERQLALGEAVRAILLVLFLAAVGLGAAGAVSAFIHLAARAEIPDLGILRGTERTGVEAIAAADAQVLGVKHDAVGRR